MQQEQQSRERERETDREREREMRETALGFTVALNKPNVNGQYT